MRTHSDPYARRPPKGSRLRRVLLTLLILGFSGTVAGYGSFAAFTATTGNTNNSFEAGSVTISDNDLGSSMLSFSNGKPGTYDTSCLTVSFTGSLSSNVRLYASTTGPLPQYLDVTVTRGTTSSGFDDCSGFTADAANYIGAGAGVVYSGSLDSLPTTWGAGIVDAPGSPETWTNGEQHAYSITVTVQDNNSAQTLSGNATFTWEARNQ